MEWIFFILGLLPYFLEMYFLKYALMYKKPEPKKLVYEPFVSIHVPIHKEPPDVVISTLESLKKQKYENYEVLVLVNNTPEEVLRKPIKDYCEKESGIFKYHYIETAGYKGGTLNKAMSLSHPKVEIIGVVDSDYRVCPDFIRKGVSYFKDKIAIVQFPQDYRDFPETLFYKAMYLSYRYFFAVIMRMCHVLGAVAFMGTVGFIRKESIKETGKWSEQIITEDSEMGLRMNLKGFKGIYVDESVGKGFMPFTWFSCRKQRFRWAYGNAQTLLKHFTALAFTKNLNFKQKVAFFIQNTVWHTPLIYSLIFNYVGGFLSFLGAGLLTGFLVSRLYSFLWIFRKIDRLTFSESVLALVFYFSLFFPMSYAPMRVLVPVEVSFYRTPKSKEEERPLYIGEIALLSLTIAELLMCTTERRWLGIYTCLLSILLFLCFLWVYRQSKISNLP
ncbi:MAG: glycosyltransferase family 2 protein [Hydrogenobacter sp.]